MLKEILAEFQQASTPLCAAELSRKLGIDPGALEGMLQTLVRCGRLLEIDPTRPGCPVCSARGSCTVMTNGLQVSYYATSSDAARDCSGTGPVYLPGRKTLIDKVPF